MYADSLFQLARHTVVVASFGHYFFGVTMTLVAIFLILLVLVQRGRGGGLAGAFGGMGGQSAFGTKAGDTFTKVTIGVSIVWILLCIASVKMLGNSSGSFGQATSPDQPQFVPGPAGEMPPVLPGTESIPMTDGAPAPSGAGTSVPATGGDTADAPSSTTASPPDAATGNE